MRCYKVNRYKEVRFSLILLLCFSMVISTLTGCSAEKPVQQTNPTDESIEQIDSNQIADEISEILNSIPEQENKNTEEEQSRGFVNEWEQYAGNLDAFVYALLYNRYQTCYDVFNASIILPTEEEIYGIGYSDFSFYCEDEEGTGYFPAGFIPLIGEDSIPTEYLSDGLIINDLDYLESSSQFVFSYAIEPFASHCVVWNQYLKYGINETGQIFYEASEYERGVCDESLGALYSYDESRYVYDPDVGTHVNLTGTSLSASINYDELEQKINEIIKTQDANFYQSEIQTILYESQEALTNYLLSLQQEEFLGVKVSELIAFAEQVDPSEFVQLTPDGIIIVNVEDYPPDDSEKLAKWLVGSACAIGIVGSIAVNVFIPALTPVVGAVSGIATEVFSQVVMQNKNLKNVDWRKVGVAAVTGVLLAWVTPMAGAKAAGEIGKILGRQLTQKAAEALATVAGYGIMAVSNGLVAGATNAVFTLWDGGTEENAWDAFWMGAAIGAACTVLAAVLSEGAELAMDAFSKAHPNNWLTKAVAGTGKFIQDHRISLFDDSLETILVPKSIHQAAKTAVQQVKLSQTFDAQLVKNVTQLPADNNPSFAYKSLEGNTISKYDLLDSNGNGILVVKDPLLNGKGIYELRLNNGIPDLSSQSCYSMNLDITGNRTVNFNKCYSKIAETWKTDPSLIPRTENFDVLTYLQENNIDPSGLNASTVKQIIKDMGFTIHERTDQMIDLVPTWIHKSIPHCGGVSLAKALELIDMGVLYFTELYSTTVPTVTGSLLPSVY